MEWGEGCNYEADILWVSAPAGTNVVVCQGGASDPEHRVVIPCETKCTSFGEVTTNLGIVRRADGQQSIICRFNPSGQ